MSAVPGSAPRRAVAAAGLLSLAAALASCAAADPATPGGTPQGRVTVLAAASLTEAFTEIAQSFEATHPGTTVRVSHGGSPALATQIEQGVPADVFASASTTSMQGVREAGLVEAPTVFARNTMEIAVPPQDPAGVRGLADLARPGVRVALCQVEVPCGATAAKVLRAAGVEVTPVTREADVRATLTKVGLGEVDAALVYVTDVRAAGAAVRGVPVPEAVNASTDYPIAPLTDAPNPALARAFVADVLGAQGREALQGHGFALP